MRKLLIASVALLALASCAKNAGQAAAANAPASASTTTASSKALPEGHPDVAGMGNMMGTGGPAAASGNAITAKVLETMNAGGYTYIKLAAPSGETWAAVPQARIEVGQTVTLNAQMTMDDFESKTLNRKFDHIIFGSLGGPAAAAAPAGMGAMGTPAQRMAGPADAGPISVPKAEGGQTVAELWTGKATLKDKPVVVRGKVVKSLDGIMGKNWIHLRDGSGNHANGSDDITVTTNDTAAVGDVVIVRGTLRVNKDFGAGYNYPVIIEDGKVTK